MNLSKVALMAVRGSGPDFKKRLAIALGVSNKVIYRYLTINSDNLTKAAALKLIKEETGLGEDQILESEVVV